MRCPAASVCLTDPSACESSLTASELALLVALATLPLLSMVWPMFSGSIVGMKNGFLVIMASLTLGFLPTFFLLLTSPYPCATAISGCGSISCACGNYYPSGYTWMDVLLTLSTLLTLREVADITCWRTRAFSALGALCLLFTGINPERFATDLTQPAQELHVGYMLHLGGLAAATGLLVFVPFLRLVSSILCRRQPLGVATMSMPTPTGAASSATMARSRRLRVLLPGLWLQ